MAAHKGPFWSIYEELKSGKITRRDFIQKASALGVGLPVTMFVLNAVGGGSAAAQAATGAPATGTESQQRGAGGELKLIQWQAPTHASQHTSTGTKDTLAASLITEPLLHFLPDASLIPNLIKEVPSLDNGLLSSDFKSVTYNLLEGVLWSDGQPFTSADVQFTWQWIIDPANQSINSVTYGVIENIETPDDLTVKITFKTPQLSWYIPFGGNTYGAVYPKHILETGPDAINAFRQNPTGTGPYKVESFKENDQVIYTINENYREPNKPYFATVNLKGGGEASAAAQAVLQTGEYHFAWNIQVEQQVLTQMEEEGGRGKVFAEANGAVERLLINFSDPNQEVNGERSEMNTPHPYFSDLAVRQALALGADRQTIATQFYLGEHEPPAVNVLTGIPAVESANTAWEFNLDKAKQTLDAAGWVQDGSTRSKDGVELKIVYSTSINTVRQKTQAVNKQNWEEIGFEVQLKQVDAGIFFDSSAGNDQNAQHFYVDLLMYTNNPSYPFPLNYMQSWYAGPDGSNISQKANGWSGVNEARYNNPDYDALYDAAAAEIDPERAAELFIQMNDILINEVVVVPLVNRGAEKYAIANELRQENVAGSLFNILYWNIVNWTASGQ